MFGLPDNLLDVFFYGNPVLLGLTFEVYAKVIKKYMCNGFAGREDIGGEEESTFEIECYECGSLKFGTEEHR
ncbi:hypothetical protein Ferp_0227 [Ferroglobus placidus DSM 10642]|uniref:Uncharacterized protein n=1 Tax=Ferroglobus placidus (strain DSM 10642 / AEDII12DO) TaxID=589924 RepID=D3S1V5_FERPA|nr:hypothetical protein [Ferroglobus placidus]ADC64412.1 hypothetical protein Ferp_0227 [Ferroglobus placidus DSM 10642]